MLRVVVLGSAAGGGFPQWNCNCANCHRARSGDQAALARTQSSLAASADGKRWFLLNASPDLRQQINQTPAMQPCEEGRHSPIIGAVLTNADVDHITGLLTLRESHPLNVYATARVQDVLSRNVTFDVLNKDLVARKTLALDEEVALMAPDGTESGLMVTAFSVPGKIALYLEDPDAPDFGSVAEDTIGLRVSAKGSDKYFFYLPGCSKMPADLAERIKGAPLVFFDGTTWTDDEMITTGVGHKTGKRMGHMCMSGDDGTIEAFAQLSVERKIFIHINNTNPALLSDSAERMIAEKAGWSVGYDGMEVEV
jgi:pyrroloquinoline quinone biosynthesis protein B